MKLIGVIAGDHDVRFDPQGVVHVMFSIRVDTAIVNAEFSGEHADAFAWEIHPYNLDGLRVAVRGEMTARRWKDREGKQHVRSYFRIDELACRLPERNVPVRFGA